MAKRFCKDAITLVRLALETMPAKDSEQFFDYAVAQFGKTRCEFHPTIAKAAVLLFEAESWLRHRSDASGAKNPDIGNHQWQSEEDDN